MVPPSNINPSLRRKSVSSPWGPAGTKHRFYSEDQRALFFETLARVGTTAEASRELGFNEATCIMWAQKSNGRVRGSSYCAEQKTEFFEVLDRSANVAAAAKFLGINVQTAFNWAYSTRAVDRKPRTILTEQQQALLPKKTEFLKILKQVGNFTEAARRTGVKRNQGESWARAAGIENVPLVDTRREEFLRLRSGGATRKEAAAAVGVKGKTAYRWDHAPAAAGTLQPEVLGTAYNCEVTSVYIESSVPACIPGGLPEGPGLPPLPGLG